MAEDGKGPGEENVDGGADGGAAQPAPLTHLDSQAWLLTETDALLNRIDRLLQVCRLIKTWKADGYCEALLTPKWRILVVTVRRELPGDVLSRADVVVLRDGDWFHVLKDRHGFTGIRTRNLSDF